MEKFFRILRQTTAVVLSIAMVVVPATSHARTLLDMFNSMGGYSNVTGPGSAQGSIGNYYTGGNLAARTPVVTTTLYNIQPPSVRRGGCGGVDMYLGGLSYVSSAQISALLRAAASNLVTELFFLALDTFVPVVSAVVKKVQAMLQVATNLSTNSCELSRTALAGMKDMGAMLSQSMTATSEDEEIGGSSTDFFAAQYESKDDATVTANNQAALSDPAKKDRVAKGNFVWRAIYNADYNEPTTAGSLIYKQILMSMIGTVIIPEDTSRGPMVLPPLQISLNDMIGGNGTGALLGATMLDLYVCDAGSDGFEMGCQNPTTTAVSTNVGTSFRMQALDRLTQMASNMRGVSGTGVRPTDPDLAYLATSDIPLYKLMALASADPQVSNQMIQQAADVLAVDYAYHYIREAYKNLSKNIAARSVAVDAVQNADYTRIMAKKDELMGQLENERVATYGKIQKTIQMAESMRSYDKVFARKVSRSLQGGDLPLGTN